ncbi:MAG: 16S rRNA (cytidine(1402)-2'-O)-methyltransferase [Saprospiraceae bacterium]|nr:16S rRNA (cytidine(1402)-2'-O)-methyltransferase [Saprospiraceae bacterium]MCB9321825.1 16S rRNA (cytidine(1402)-2'-O)-methyltransferase [Lewinellaceae bacterium]
MLYIVPTPIGNLGDMTSRSIEVLRQVELILAEDTRTSKVLLDHFGIQTTIRAFHQHNEHQVLSGLLDLLHSGSDLALISDAGTPGISDPGFLLVRACREAGVEVTVLPGATAFVPALVASGLPCDRFHFEGFLPHKKGRQSRLQWLAVYPYTIILYESPHRLIKCLEQIKTFLSDRKICVAREISKMHEDIRTGTVDELLAHYREQSKVRGEVVLIVGPAGFAEDL